MPEKNRELITLLTQQGLTEAQAKREINESNEDWNWIRTWLYKKVENTPPPGVIDQRINQRIDALRNSRNATKTSLHVKINTELRDLIDFLSLGWPTADKRAPLEKQTIVELLLTSYLTDHTDEAIEVLSRHLEKIAKRHKAT